MEKTRQNPEELLKAVKRDDEAKKRGHLKIFFGYAAGVGKTYAMLEAAKTARSKGVDVVAGYVDPHDRPKTMRLAEGIESIDNITVEQNGILLREFDLDAAIKRRPELILVDDLAHTNAVGLRHNKRHQDIKELLQAGIDVYTTVNVQNIESLNDQVASITGVMVRERIPDHVFDDADQVELVDIEPKELIERLKAGEIYKKEFADMAVGNFFKLENLTALREIALRRCADRVNKLTETARIKSNSDYHTDEHILVGLSSSPSNAKIIRTAARMANAFKGAFTALFVETSDFAAMDEEDKKRLRANIRLAQQLGAKVETTYGDDIPFQIAEFARLSGVSQIVIGRSMASGKGPFSKPKLTEQLVHNAPNLDVHIIPDTQNTYKYRNKKLKQSLIFSLSDILKCILILAIASVVGYLFQMLGFAESNIITVYVLAVLIISVITVNHIYSFIASIVSVLVFNFLFTVPTFSFQAYDKGYPVTFLIMFLAALLTGSLATKLKNSAKQSARSAYRTKVLFDTNQLLQQSQSSEEIAEVTMKQAAKLLNRSLVVYLANRSELSEPLTFPIDEETDIKELVSAEERAVAEWVFKNNKHAGATTQTFSEAGCLYLAIRVNEVVYGVVGIAIEDVPLDSFETSILLSILGECALALESKKNAAEKEEAAILAKNEQLRANLLRAISHDLRTPLTSISGNASNLLSNGDSFDKETKKGLYQDIYDDSMWLINLVENLLSVTRLEEGRMNMHISAELVDEVIAEALKHANRLKKEHIIKVDIEDEFMLAKMDAKLIVQVIINLVDNAIKYTDKGSEICISAREKGDMVEISVADNGRGIPNEHKKQVFDMFYSGANKVADSRRSLGLGLSLCKSIINVHGGKICVSDNDPHGAVFTFTLPKEEVMLNE